MTPTPAQLAALRLAAQEPIQYFRGGWYSCRSLFGPVDRQTFRGPSTAPQTLNACVVRGWLQESGDDPEGARSIYARRWTITDAGRAVLGGEPGLTGREP